jgi:hypothetical protein
MDSAYQLTRCPWCRYNVLLDAAAVEQLLPETLLATAETVNVLPASGPYSDYDLSIVAEIVRLAEETAQQDYAAGRGSREVTLVRLLQAYEVVLPAHGVVPAEDVFYYRLLLKLSLDPNPDWYAKLEQQRATGSRYEMDTNQCGRAMLLIMHYCSEVVLHACSCVLPPLMPASSCL